MKKKKTKEKKIKPTWSLGFFLATFGNFLLIPMVFTLLLFSPSRKVEAYPCLLLFAFGVISSAVIVSTSKLEKFRTILHEMKHAVVVMLTGNKVKKIVAEKNEGFVEYEMYEGQMHFAPLIALAPYFFPILGFPALIAALLYDFTYPVHCSLALGLALGTDTTLGLAEIHPGQTDFKQVGGGIILSKMYLSGFYILWPSIVMLWVKCGYLGINDGVYAIGKFISERAMH